jgi:hypothetical protein
MFAFPTKLLLCVHTRLRSRARLEPEPLALRPVSVLRRKSSPRVWLRKLDPPSLVWLYRFFPLILNAIASDAVGT